MKRMSGKSKEWTMVYWYDLIHLEAFCGCDDTIDLFYSLNISNGAHCTCIINSRWNNLRYFERISDMKCSSFFNFKGGWIDVYTGVESSKAGKAACCTTAYYHHSAREKCLHAYLGNIEYRCSSARYSGDRIGWRVWSDRTFVWSMCILYGRGRREWNALMVILIAPGNILTNRIIDHWASAGIRMEYQQI